MISINYFVQLTWVAPRLAGGRTEGVAPFLFTVRLVPVRRGHSRLRLNERGDIVRRTSFSRATDTSASRACSQRCRESARAPVVHRHRAVAERPGRDQFELPGGGQA